MTKIVILAAGKGKRMRGELPKVLAPLAGKPMMEYLIQSIIKSGIDKEPIIVASPDNKGLIKQALKKYNCKYALQSEQLGTGHALACAKDLIGREAKNIIIFYGDHPFVRPETIKNLAASRKGVITMITTKVKDFNGWRKNFYHWGKILRDKGEIRAIVEFKDASDELKKIQEVNPGFYRFDRGWLWDNIQKIKNNNAQKEYYLTDLIKLAFNQKQTINSLTIDPKEAIGINTSEELAIAEKLI